MPKKQSEDDWGSESGSDDFPESVYGDSFPANEDNNFNKSQDKWGATGDSDESKWHSFTPDESPNYDAAADGFGKETQDTWGKQPNADANASNGAAKQMPPGFAFPQKIPRDEMVDRKSTRLNYGHKCAHR